MMDFHFSTHDDLQLCAYAHINPTPKAVLIFLHGLNEHAGRYGYPIDYFSKNYSLYLYDQRGHGRSAGRRAFVDSFQDYVKDLARFVALVANKEPGRKIFLIAHSMGGQVALNYLGTHSQAPLTGFVTSSPNIRIAWKVSRFKKALALKIANCFPRLRVLNEVNPKWISRDKAWVRSFVLDPLVNKIMTINLAKEIIMNQEHLVDLAANIHLPALMLHAGDDHICSPQGSRDFFANLGSQDKTLKIYYGFYHEIFNDPEREQVFGDIEKWVKDRIL